MVTVNISIRLRDNVDIYHTKILQLEQAINYTFTNRLLCLEALNLGGPLMLSDGNYSEHKVCKNDRLAVLGILIAQGHLCNDVHTRGSTKADWEQAKKDYLGQDKLAQIFTKNSFETCTILNAGTRYASSNMRKTTVEAIFGAVHRDSNGQAVAGVMRTLGIPV